MAEDTKIDDQAATIDSINNDTITAEELRTLRANLATTPAAQRKEIDEALTLFEERNAELLETDDEISGELDALRLSLDTADKAEPAASPLPEEKPEEKPAEKIEEPAVEPKEPELPPEPAAEPRRATAIVYDRWKEMMDPNHSPQGRILRAAGFVAAGYGIYRLATWITGRPKNTFMWKAVKYTGLAALAAWTIGVLTHKKEGPAAEETEPEPETTPEPTPAPAPEATPAPGTKPPEATAAALDAFPSGTDLVNGKTYEVPVDGKTYRVQFTKSAIMINGKKFTLTAKGAGPFGTDVNLSILNARTAGKKLSVTAGAFGRSGGTEWSEDELKGLLSELFTKGSSEQISTDATGGKTTVLIKSIT